MKQMIGLFVLVLTTSITSQACSQYEAQFIGKVVKIERTSADACTVQIDFSSFNSSIMCPLDISEADDKEITTTQCDKKAKDTISGILVDDGEKLFVE
jgi:aerobic-type carbon monoxide dehydrogenase small subunit (CoxS/CutS family)